MARSEIEGELHAGWSTEYIWRGIDQGGADLVEAGLDVGTSLEWFDVSAGIWYGSVNGTSGDFDEVDYYGGISKDLTFGGFEGTLSAGYIHFDFPTGGPNLQEIYFGASTNIADLIDLGFTYYWDIDGDNDGYSEFTADYSRELNDDFALNFGLTLSYDWETSDLHHYGANLSLDYAFNDVLTISPYVAVTFAEDGAESGALAIGPGQGDELFGGIIVTAGF